VGAFAPIWVVPQKLKLLSLSGMKAFFIHLEFFCNFLVEFINLSGLPAFSLFLTYIQKAYYLSFNL